MKISIVNNSPHPLPQYQTSGAAAFDIYAAIAEPITLKSLERAMVPTGLHIALPVGYVADIRPRSGLAAQHGISIVNSPATIDSDFRGEWKVILINLSTEPYTIQDGDRIAQVVILKCETAEWESVSSLDKTDRHTGGFGHTGR
jgi:dUTP pyrophosphatase